MTNADAEVVAWLATIADDEERQAVARAIEAASQAEYVDADGEDVYTPFVYPH